MKIRSHFMKIKLIPKGSHTFSCLCGSTHRSALLSNIYSLSQLFRQYWVEYQILTSDRCNPQTLDMFSLDFIACRVICLRLKVTSSLPLPGTVHCRDISTTGAAVCLISPTHTWAEERVGQPTVGGPFLTSDFVIKPHINSR